MSDITKCHGDACPKRNDCYRYTSPAGYFQAWMAPNKVGDMCGFYWPLNIRTASNETDIPPHSHIKAQG